MEGVKYMLDSRYYDGYEGEEEVDLSCDNGTGMRIWRGYFELLLSGCYGGFREKDGFMESYHSGTGYYDESHWRLPNPETALRELDAFSAEQVDAASPELRQELERLRVDLMHFLQSAKDTGSAIFVDW